MDLDESIISKRFSEETMILPQNPFFFMWAQKLMKTCFTNSITEEGI